MYTNATNNRNPRTRSAGFTLTEMLVVLSLIAVLAGLSILAYKGAHSKAVVLYSKLTQYGDALIRMQLDMSCYPSNTSALLIKADASDSFCGDIPTDSWHGPYAKADAVDDNNNIKLLDVGAGVILTIEHDNETNDKTGLKPWYIKAEHVPLDIVGETMSICNHDQDSGRCSKVDEDDKKATVRYTFDQSMSDGN